MMIMMNGSFDLICSCVLLEIEGHRMDFKTRSLCLPWIRHQQVPNQNVHRYVLRLISLTLDFLLTPSIWIQMVEKTLFFKRSSCFPLLKAFVRSMSLFGTTILSPLMILSAPESTYYYLLSIILNIICYS
jgi:hypothetical protein